jgi:hypothetical protein
LLRGVGPSELNVYRNSLVVAFLLDNWAKRPERVPEGCMAEWFAQIDPRAAEELTGDLEKTNPFRRNARLLRSVGSAGTKRIPPRTDERQGKTQPDSLHICLNTCIYRWLTVRVSGRSFNRTTPRPVNERPT